MTLDAADVEAIARRVAELMELPSPLVDAQAVAAELGVERSWVYGHARELGAVRLGHGPKARLRFDVASVRERVGQLDERPADESRPRRRRTGRRFGAPGVKLIEGRSSRGMLSPSDPSSGPAGAPTPPGPAPEVSPTQLVDPAGRR